MATCADTWAGNSSVTILTPGLPGADIVSTASITWTYDPTTSGPDFVAYKPSGTFDLAIHTPEPGCTITLSPRSFAIAASPLTPQALWIYNTPGNATYSFLASQFVNTTSTFSCPGKEDVVTQFKGFLVNFAQGSGPFTLGQASLTGVFDDGAVASTWNFTRP